MATTNAIGNRCVSDLTLQACNLSFTTATSSSGIISIATDRFVHRFNSNTNAFIGASSGNFTTTAIHSAGLGYRTLLSLGAAASDNTAVGYQSLIAVATGTNNTALGSGAGSSLTTTDSSNILINNSGTVGDNNVLRIGAATGTSTQQLNKSFIHGIRGITTTNADAIAVLVDSAGQLGTVSSSIRYKENVEDMGSVSSHVLNLRPVTFDFIGKPSHKKQVGLIAEEVEQVMPSLVAYNQDGQVESVKYHDLPALLLNELQKAVKRIDELESKLNSCCK